MPGVAPAASDSIPISGTDVLQRCWTNAQGTSSENRDSSRLHGIADAAATASPADTEFRPLVRDAPKYGLDDRQLRSTSMHPPVERAVQSSHTLHNSPSFQITSGASHTGNQNSLTPGANMRYTPSPFRMPGAHPNINLDATAFDADIWNPNFLSTINWLADATSDFENQMSSLPLSESVYLNNFSQPLDPIAPSQSFEINARSLDQVAPAEVSGQVWSPDDNRSFLTGSSEQGSESMRSEEKRAKSGKFYLDSDSGRLPRVKRRRHSFKPVEEMAELTNVQYSLQYPTHVNFSDKPVYELPTEVYDQISRAFQTTCITPPMQFYQFSSSSFPPKEFLEYLVSLYFQSFHPILPFLHHPTFAMSRPHWHVLLAMMAVGSHFLEAEWTEIFVTSVHEFLRRTLRMAEEDPLWLPQSEVDRTQIRILHAVGAMYSGDQRSGQVASSLRYHFSEFGETHWQHDSSSDDDHSQIHLHWSSWIDVEIRRRTGYCAWLLDCMWAFHFQRRPLLALEQAKYVLPCHEKLWAASNAEDWRRLQDKLSAPPTLLSAAYSLYVDKHVSSDLGEFARILLIHGIFHRSWEVETYHRQVLSRWEPTARLDSSRDTNRQNYVWLPSVPTYAKWRNSACDSLDVLHWIANSQIGIASGMEHPTVLHLHLARVLLLTPINDIINFAQNSAEWPLACSQKQMLEYEQSIRKWATQDQYKARLAMIHAGVLFWHVRRFSANGFYEPHSVALATLALWAFGTFHNKPLASTEREHSPPVTRQKPSPHSATVNRAGPVPCTDDQSDSDDPIGCDIILLDRPTDDELVQNFVRRGHTMVANLAGVGNLYDERGPELVLQEGRKLLYSLTSWGVRRKWIGTLNGLLDLIRRKKA